MHAATNPDDSGRERERHVLRLVAAAQELPAQERHAFLLRECGADARLLDAAKRLLASSERLEKDTSFLRPPDVTVPQRLDDAVARGEELAAERAVASVAAALSESYRLGPILGRGGSGVVYRATDLRHRREVAVKIVGRELASAAQRERFLREVAISARLQHPYIVPLIDSGEVSGALYYVMPYLEGETLKQRLDREGALPLPEIVNLVSEIAEALAFAHANGVVHRDIKPSNILLQRGHALVADFGIALALQTPAEGRLTERGVTIGTPSYMSPEQVGGSARLDGRSDIYSLGCVVYEMLAGEVPFTGPSAGSVLAKHLHATVPRLSIVRPSLSPAIQAVVDRAMAKSAADRFDTAVEFSRCLRDACASSPNIPTAVLPLSWWRRTRIRPVLARAAVGILGAAVLGLGMRWARDLDSAPPRMAGSIVVFPSDRRGIVPAHLDEVQRLRHALTRWKGLTLADPLRVDEALEGRNVSDINLSESHRIATSLGAERFVRTSIAGDARELRIEVMMYDLASGGAMVAEASERIPASLPGIDSVFAALVDELLFQRSIPDDIRLERHNTYSYPAYRDFLLGHTALVRWDLPAAESLFEAATEADRRFVEGWLWLGLTRRWAGQEVARWKAAAERAAGGIGLLGARDSALAGALLSLAKHDVGTACASLEKVVARFPSDYSVWYASADCLDHDQLVVRDVRDPSAWRFRSSYHSALERYRRAFELMPSIYLGLRRDGFEPARRIFLPSRSVLRKGFSATDSFYASPAVRGDSLVLVPIPAGEFERRTSPSLRGLERATSTAVQRQRGVFRDMAAAWLAASPRSAEAHEAMGIALQLLGDPAAIDTLARARQLASTLTARASVALTSVMVAVRLGAPDDAKVVQSAKDLADTLLAPTSVGYLPPSALATIAALTGRAFDASAFARRVSGNDDGLTPEQRDVSNRLTVYAAMGGPADSLAILERRLESLLEAAPGPNLEALRLRTFARIAALALPSYEFPSIGGMPSGYYLTDATRAAVRGDSATVRRLLAESEAARAFVAPEDRTFDTILSEAILLERIGDTAEAARRLDAPLTAQRRSSNRFTDPVLAGSFLRAMALRAELAARLGDRETAARWAHCVAVLWSSADPFLQPVVARMRALMS